MSRPVEGHSLTQEDDYYESDLLDHAALSLF